MCATMHIFKSNAATSLAHVARILSSFFVSALRFLTDNMPAQLHLLEAARIFFVDVLSV